MAPFIYIAALRRTGSTVLSEFLTSFPDSFIFREPKLGSGRFTVKENDAALFKKHGIDLTYFARKWHGRFVDRLLTPGRVVGMFERELMPALLSVVKQIGVKEIRHAGWHYYVDSFPDMRVVLTGRDPRDIYISTHRRVRQGKDRFRRGFSARELARNLRREFKQQLAISKVVPTMWVRYEDFCVDGAVRHEIMKFVGAGDVCGSIGQFNSANPLRTSEAQIHGGQITGLRVRRWEHEQNPEVAREAQRMIKLMPDYAELWQYEN